MSAAAGALAVGLAAAVFVSLLSMASIAVTVVTDDWIHSLRMVGGAVRRWSGYALVLVGIWFLVLSVTQSPVLV